MKLETGSLALFLLLYTCCDVVQGECQEILVPMCRGLVDYTHTKLPNSFGHTTQAQVYLALDPLWQFMDMGCSADFRSLACGTYLPKCTTNATGSDVIERPCRETCFQARRGCKKTMRQNNFRWPFRVFRCGRLRRRRQRQCIRPVPRRERVARTRVQYAYCEPNQFDICQNLSQDVGSLPNMFRQSDPYRIQLEMEQYRPIFNCHPDFRFLVCGTFKPFCVSNDSPVTLPCRETCQEVRSACEAEFRTFFGGIPWPAKLQCHRYPSGSNRQSCVTPTD